MRLKTLAGIAALIVLAPAAFGQDQFDFVWRRPAINSPSSLSFHPDGYAFVAGYNHACFAVTTSDGLVIKTFDFGSYSSCRFGSFSPDGQFLAVSVEGFRGSVSFSIYETQTWTSVESFYTNESFTNATGVLFSPDSRSLIGCLTRSIHVLDVPSFTRRFLTQASCPASISPNSELLVVDTTQGAKLLGLQDGLDRTPPSGYPGLRPPWALGDNWIALSEPNGIHVKTLTESPQELAMMPAYRPQALVRSPDDRLIGGAFNGGAEDKMIQIWETDGFSSIGSWPTGASFDSGSVLAFTSDSQSLAIAENIDRDPVKLWSVPDGTLQEVLITDQVSNTELVFSPDNQLLAGGFGQDGHIRLWQSADGGLVQTLGGRGQVTSLAFSPDGRFIGSGGDNLNVWSLPDGALIQSIPEPTIKIALSADGLLAQQLADEVHLRTLPDLSLVRTIPRGDRIAFSPDGRQILVGGDLFGVDTGSLLGSFPSTHRRFRSFLSTGTPSLSPIYVALRHQLGANSPTSPATR
jgi:WD40 repeat protein